MRSFLYLLLVGLIACGGMSRRAAAVTAPVTVTVDGTLTHQTMVGFGAGHTPRSLPPDRKDLLTPSQRARAINATYRDVGLTTGYLDTALLESPGAYDQRRNDNADPAIINWAGFQTFRADTTKTNILDPAQPLGFTDYTLAERINVRWASPWLATLRGSDRTRYLDEAAEQVAAGHLYWRDTYGVVPSLNLLFNEPLSGNGELFGGTNTEVVDLINRVGARLRSDGFANVRFLVPNEETVARSLDTATAILANASARQYVGAIGYHAYPYGSAYSSINQILATTGNGQPVAAEIATRQQLRDLGRQYGIPLWMTEISHGGVDPRSFASLRARAIHIHDELVYADAVAYLAFGNIWDRVSQQQHFGNTNLFSGNNEGFVTFVDQNADTVTISGLGYAIGHYARWIKKGAVRLEATSADPLMQVTAFRDDAQRRLVMVLINNAAAEKNVHVTLSGMQLTASITGEQSTAAATWQGLTPIAAATGGQSVDLSLPAGSVTTIAGAFVQPTDATQTSAQTKAITATRTATPPFMMTSTRVPTIVTRTATTTPAKSPSSTRASTQPTDTPLPPTATPDPVIGDVNCDGRAAVADITALVEILATGDSGACQREDVSRDGRVDDEDLEVLVDRLFA